MCEEACEFFRCTSGTWKAGPRERSPAGGVLRPARVTRHSWLVARDANMSPVEFQKKLWSPRNRMHVVAPEKASTSRSKSAKGEWIAKVYDCGLKGDISQMKVVEDFESRPHKAVSCMVEREKVVQVWNEQKMPKALPGKSGGKLPGGSTKEKAETKRTQTRRNQTKMGRSGKWPQQACTTMFLLIPKNVTSEGPIALMPALIR